MSSIIRRIDDLGRIVIPKDIRKELRINTNDLVELEVENNKIIINKNKTNDNYIKLINKIINNLYKITKNNIIITNKDIVLDCKTNDKENIKNEKICENIIKKILNRNKINKKGLLNITNNYSINCNYIFDVIIINSIEVGSIIYFSNNNITESEIKLIQLTKLFIENNIEE